MAGKINMAKALCFLIAFSFVMMSCTPALTVPPSPTTTPSKTPMPSVTPTLTPSPTATATPTPNPSQIAEVLGLPVEVKLNDSYSYFHKYRMDGDYLRDDYNNTIAAVRENGVWRALGESQEDKNLKYGELADGLGMDPFGSTSEKIGSDPELDLANLNAVFTGEYRVDVYIFSTQNKIINDYRGWFVYKDGNGNVQKVFVSMFSPDLKGAICIRNPQLTCAGMDEAISHFRPGGRFRILFVRGGPNRSDTRVSCTDYWLLLYLLNN